MPSNAWASSTRLPQFFGLPGESWESYEADIQLAYDGAGQVPTSDSIKRAHLLIGLQGEAGDFLRKNPHLRTDPYEKVLESLRKRFTVPGWKKIGQLQNAKQEPGESVRGFAERLKGIAGILSPEKQFIEMDKKDADKSSSGDIAEKLTPEQLEERKKVYNEPIHRMVFHFFLQGLRPSLQRDVRSALPQTLEEAVAVAEKHEDYQAIHDEMASLNITVAEPKSDPTVQKAEEHLKALNNSRPDRRSKTPEGGQDQGVQARAEVRCFNCNRKGHYARNCGRRVQFRTGPHSMEGDGTPLRRQMQTLSRKVAAHQRSYEVDPGRMRRVRLRPPRFRDSPYDRPVEHRERDRRKTKGREVEHSTWLQEGEARKPKNGERPPRRGGLPRLPRPVRLRA